MKGDVQAAYALVRPPGKRSLQQPRQTRCFAHAHDPAVISQKQRILIATGHRWQASELRLVSLGSHRLLSHAYMNIDCMRGSHVPGHAHGMMHIDEVAQGAGDEHKHGWLPHAGHHAERAEGMGFCIFNNIAVAAAAALEVHGLTRVAIVDYDVHHGNGTQVPDALCV